ncbi:hypothetical protein [Thalassobaculum sp.]|uniref:hypothetical protein n=1 Tax=Thalassobaculum sp. TaxID=2022740 RepID=UPI0032F039FE
MSAAQRDLRALFAEERAAAAQSSPAAYRALLERRLAERPVVLDVGFFEQVLANLPWADELRPLAAKLIGYPATPPDTVLLLNTFPRVPTAAAETVLVESLGLRRGSVYPGNTAREAGFDLSIGIRELRSRSLVRSHLIASIRFRACLAALAVRPIVLVRDIFDTIASYADDRTDPAVAPGYRLAALDPQARRRILVLRMAAQLVDFHGTWSIEQTAGRCTVYRWEDVHEDWPGFLVDRLEERGHRLLRGELAEKLAKLPPDAHSQINLGNTLSDADKALVRALYAQYPNVDFRPIDQGAPPPSLNA